MATKWEEGFFAGVCSALACLAAHDASGTEYREIVMACGGMDLVIFARRENDSQYQNILAAVTESARRNNRSATRA